MNKKSCIHLNKLHTLNNEHSCSSNDLSEISH